MVMLGIKLGDIEIGWLIWVFLFFMIAYPIIFIIHNVIDNKKDDSLPQYMIRGFVIDKTTEIRGIKWLVYSPCEWIIVEEAKGNRHRLRNVHLKEIFISSGDRCEIKARGSTIYGYSKLKDDESLLQREKKATHSFGTSQEHIPAWKQVEMERRQNEETED